MKKTPSKNKSAGRQQAEASLPSSAVLPSAASNAVTAKKKTRKAAVRRSGTKKSSAPKSFVLYRKKSKGLMIPVWPGLRLSISLKKTARKPAKSKPENADTKAKRKPASRSSTATAVILIMIGLAGTGWFTYRAVYSPTPQPLAYSPPAPVQSNELPEPPKAVVMPEAEPIQLTIPDVGINTSVFTVGKQADGTLEVPVRHDIVGWYKHGPTPGELGPSIIVGHVDSPKGPAVFWRLRELVPGQIIEIRRADGSVAKFKVNSVKEFEQNNFPTAEVYGNIGHAGLRLITCGGNFNRITGHYSHNTVVFASLDA